MIDLPRDQLDSVRAIIAEHLGCTEVFAFGSRVTGKAKKFSDLDLMIRSDTKLDWLKLANLRESFEASSLPISVDVINWANCSETFQKLVEHQLEPLKSSAAMFAAFSATQEAPSIHA